MFCRGMRRWTTGKRERTNYFFMRSGCRAGGDRETGINRPLLLRGLWDRWRTGRQDVTKIVLLQNRCVPKEAQRDTSYKLIFSCGRGIWSTEDGDERAN